MALDASNPRSRRALLISAAAGLAAAAATVLRPLRVAALDEGVTYVNNENDDPVVSGSSLKNGPNTGGGFGVYGQSHSSSGVRGESTSGAGVDGHSINGRGGRFMGPRAQVRLIPGDTATHPASGAAGDLFVDRRKRLWFCRGGSDWVRVA